MAFKPNLKEAGDVIKSKDWNDTVQEIARLNKNKLDLQGGTLSGGLTIGNGKSNGKSAHLKVAIGDNLESVVTSNNQLCFESGEKRIMTISKNGVGVGVAEPIEGLAVNGPVVRKVWVATGLGPYDHRDEGFIDGRVLNFRKYYDNTTVRVVYCDNFRVHTPGGNYPNHTVGRWEIMFNGNSAPGGRIFQDLYSNNGGGYSNNHIPGTILGFANGLDAGDHTISVKVGPVPEAGGDHPDRFTGWHNSRWSIEAEEVWIHEEPNQNS